MRTVVWCVAAPALTALAFAVHVTSTTRQLREVLSQEARDLSGRAIEVAGLLDARVLVVFLACCTVVVVLALGLAVMAWKASRSKWRTLATAVGVAALFAPMLVGIDFALFQYGADVSSVCFIPEQMKAMTGYAVSCLRVGCATTALLVIAAGVGWLVVLRRSQSAASSIGGGDDLEVRVFHGLAAAMGAAAMVIVTAALPYATEVPPPAPLPLLPPCQCESPKGVAVSLDTGSPLDWERASELALELRRTGPALVTVSDATPLDVVSAALATIRDHGVTNACLQGIDDPGFDSRVLGRVRAPRVWRVFASSAAAPGRQERRVAVEGRRVGDELPAILEQLRRGDATTLLLESPGDRAPTIPPPQKP